MLNPKSTRTLVVLDDDGVHHNMGDCGTKAGEEATILPTLLLSPRLRRKRQQRVALKWDSML